MYRFYHRVYIDYFQLREEESFVEIDVYHLANISVFIFPRLLIIKGQGLDCFV